MTDTSSTSTTHPIPQPFPVTTSALASPVVNGSLSDTHAQEEEDYTIKCICTYADDDGNTVYCEKCETWQHIECYYPDQAVPEFHFCADCQPRLLDRKRATERQKRLREQSDGGDRKSKRPPSKSHKKKIKQLSATDQANGWHKHERHDSAATGRDQLPPSKKPKIGHHTSGSVHSLNGTPHLTDSRRRAFSNGQSYPSPTKSPQDHHAPSIPTYTDDFLELYERDEGKHNVSADGENFHTISATTKLTAWRRDPQLLAEETNRHDLEQPFIHSDLPLDRDAWPPVSLEPTMNTDVEYDGKYPQWRFLKLRTDVRKNQLVGEIKGHIGELQEYCQDTSNRWQELQHPEPFVFFHPSMPIYIDSRREGTQFRYIRRSCRPNVTLKTYATSDGQCHYCFVALHDLSAGTELTAQWYMNRLSQEKGFEDMERSYNWASWLLANFGDCACDKTAPCILEKLDRRRSPKTLENTTKSHAKKKRIKNKQAISPLSTGQATNSRAGSENVRVQEDDDLVDSRSISGSSRSKSQSRDNTPINMGILDADPVLGSSLTAREKRKIALAEKAFEKVEQSQNSQKKKKRTSGGSTLNTPSASTSHQLGYHLSSMPNTPGVFNRPAYADASTSNRFSGSPPPLKSTNPRQRSNISPRKTSAPTTPSLFSPHPRPTYVDQAMQTEPEETEHTDAPPPKRRKFSTPNQRLLKRVLEDRARFDQQRSEGGTFQPSQTPSPSVPSPTASKMSEDIEMKDGYGPGLFPSQLPTSGGKLSESPESIKNVATGLQTSPLPSQAAHSYANLHPPNGQRLQLSTLPPVPSFSSPNVVTTPASATTSPVTTTPSVAQSPFGFGIGSNSYPGLSGSAVAPSPVKKKLSLGDYMSRRSNLGTTPTTEKSQSQSLETIVPASSQEPLPKVVEAAVDNQAPPSTMVKPNESLMDEATVMGGVEGSAVEDTPMKDEPGLETLSRTVSAPQFMANANDNPTPPPRSLVSPPGVIPPELASVLSTLNALTRPSSSHRSHSASSS